MAFAKNHPYLAAAPNDFFIFNPKETPDDEDAHNSRGRGPNDFRDGFGSTLFRYARPVTGYDPMSGNSVRMFPARQLMLTALTRWMEDFGIDGLRLDSIENVQNWDFIRQYRATARELNRARHVAAGATNQAADARFLVVGEELTEPLGLVDADPTRRRLDGLWHEKFKHYIRAALVGRNHQNESTFEATVRKALDCRAFGYGDQTEAVIYLTSHDVEGFENERLFNFFMTNGVADAEKRTKLAFACLLTAVGLPMILAGDEFADQHDLFDGNGKVSQGGGKQVDPVNFSRRHEPWRKRVLEYVSRLNRLRTSSAAFDSNDIEFIHVDFNEGKRVLAWRRGAAGSAAQVVVVANFSDFGTPDPFNPGARYVVQNWPAAPGGAQWLEVPQNRRVPQNQVGREPIFPWEAKVYSVEAARARVDA
jgi:1,4-alpha-glucan branching enzyme